MRLESPWLPRLSHTNGSLAAPPVSPAAATWKRMSSPHCAQQFILGCVLFLLAAAASAAEPLPSWRDSAPKRAIIAFVEKVTAEGMHDFIPVDERIAVLDNDGTLWTEAPVPEQVDFVFYELKRRAPEEPALAADPMVKAALAGDIDTLMAGKSHAGLMRILELTHTGMTTDQFDARVAAWAKQFKHPRFSGGLAGTTYKPMRELLDYLRANGFKTYIVSGGGIDFMRVFAEQLYGIPPEQMIGSASDVTFSMDKGVPTLTKTAANMFVDDKAGKPAAIHRQIGRRPVFAAGNSDGDQAMLEYTTIDNPRPSFGLLVHHTDAKREYAYDAKPPASGTLVTALQAAPSHGWTVVDMKQDWVEVFGRNPGRALGDDPAATQPPPAKDIPMDSHQR